LDTTYLVIILVALSQGVQGLSDLAMSYLYKDDLKLQPYEVAKINSLVYIPWIIKPVYGFISDSFPIMGYRRKPYLFIFGISVIFCWLSMATWVDTVYSTVFIVLINQFSTAFCNVIGEALVVETSQRQKELDPESGAKNVSIYFLVRSIGSLLTAFSSGALLEVMNKRRVFLITATFPLLIVISAYLLDEKKVEPINYEEEQNNNVNNYSTIEGEKPREKYSKFDDLKKQISLFYTFLKMDAIYKPVIFIFCYMLTPSYGDPLFYFYTNVLKFAPMTMGRLRLIYGIASVIGIWFYNKYLRNVGFKKIMWWTTMLSMFFNMLSIVVVSRFNLKLGIPDFWFCLTADALTTALAEINTMPLLVLACNICPKNIEGTLYAFLMSVINLGSLFSNQFGSTLTSKLGITSSNFDNLSLLIFIANIVLIVPMPALYLVNDEAYVSSSKEENKNTQEKETEKLFDHSKDTHLNTFETNLNTLEEVKVESVSLDSSFNNLKENSFTKL